MRGTLVFTHTAEDQRGRQVVLTIEGLKNGLRLDVATNTEVATMFVAYDEAIDATDFCIAIGCQSKQGYQRAKTIGFKRLIGMLMKLKSADEAELNGIIRDDRQVVLPAIMQQGEALR